MIWGAMSSAGVGPLFFLKANVTTPVYQYILEHFMLPSADQLLKMLISFSSRIWHLPTLPKVIEYIYSKRTYFPEANNSLKMFFCIGLMKYSNLLAIGGFLLNVSQNHHN